MFGKGTMVAGGVSNVVEINKKSGRLDIFDFDPDPTVRHTFWSLVIGSTFRRINLLFSQSTIQRINATPRQRDANKVLIVSGPAFFLTLSLALLEGLVAFAYFSTTRCDPLASDQITNPNQVIPYMVLDIFRNIPGMSGLFMASLFSASLSTMSSGLSSLSAVTVKDLIIPHVKQISEKRLTLIAKVSVVIYGLLSMAASFLIAKIKGPMSQITSSVLSAFNGPMTGIFLLGIFCPWVEAKGAFVGGVTGVLFTFWLSMGSNFSRSLSKTPWLPLAPTDQCFPVVNDSLLMTTMNLSQLYVSPLSSYQTSTMMEDVIRNEPQGLDKFYALSYQWFSVVGVLVTMVVGTVISLIVAKYKPEEADVRFMLPFFDQFFPFLPKRLRRYLYFGVDFERRGDLLKSMVNGYDKANQPPQLRRSNSDHEEVVELSPLARRKTTNTDIDDKL